MIEEFCAKHGMAMIGTVPQDEALAEAERHEHSPFDFAPDSPAVIAVRHIADAIETLATTLPPGAAGAAVAARA